MIERGAAALERLFELEPASRRPAGLGRRLVRVRAAARRRRGPGLRASADAAGGRGREARLEAGCCDVGGYAAVPEPLLRAGDQRARGPRRVRRDARPCSRSPTRPARRCSAWWAGCSNSRSTRRPRTASASDRRRALVPAKLLLSTELGLEAVGDRRSTGRPRGPLRARRLAPSASTRSPRRCGARSPRRARPALRPADRRLRLSRPAISGRGADGVALRPRRAHARPGPGPGFVFGHARGGSLGASSPGSLSAAFEGARAASSPRTQKTIRSSALPALQVALAPRRPRSAPPRRAGSRRPRCRTRPGRASGRRARRRAAACSRVARADRPRPRSGRRGASSRRGSPSGPAARRRRSRPRAPSSIGASSSLSRWIAGPPAREIAPATPPPWRRSVFAAFAIASTSSAVMSPSSTSIAATRRAYEG